MVKSIAKSWVMDLSIYEPGKPIEDLARELGCEDPDVIDKLASNENALGPSPRAVEAMKKSAEQMHRYPDGSAHYLRQALGSRLGVKPDQILVASGSNEILEFIGHVFLEPGVDVVMASQAFAVYRLIAAMFQARVIAVPMRDYTHDLDAMLAAITPKTKVVFVANPNNPTGTMVGDEAIDRFVDGLPDHVVVCFDEAYIELIPQDCQPNTLKYVREGRKVILLRTFSKTYGLAGLRIGYAVAPEEGIALMNRVRQPFNVNAMALAAGLAALEDEDHVEKTRKLTREGLSFFEERLSRLGVPYVPSVANFLLVEVGQGREISRAMEKEHVIVRPMDAYGLPRHIRVTVGTREENKRCIKALAKVTGNVEPKKSS
ncbi:histidinol-phosphate transaminase [Verrucomicrobiota bacterium]